MTVLAEAAAAGLRLAPGLTLPPEIITDTIAIFGTRGSGKSTSGTVLVEEAHALELPTVILDPKGDWWGLRSSAAGKAGGGLPFVIFGGDHADVPLEPTAGTLLADLIVDQRIDAVLDLSSMSKSSQRRFAMDFAERLYRRNREALLVVVDEADIVIPQRVSADMLRLLGAWEDIAKRGRGRGLGLAVLTQRPQDVAKSVLDEMHALLLHGMAGPRAMKAIREWVDNHADDGAPTAEILGSLGSLQPGEGWMWAPFRHVRQRVRVRRIRTFDSHATPKPGQRRLQPRARAVDLKVLGEQIAATVERAKADDPKALRARVADLERALAAERAKPAPAAVVKRVEVPGIDPAIISRLEAALAPITAVLDKAREALAASEQPQAKPEIRIGPRRTVDELRPAAARAKPEPALPREVRPAAPAGGLPLAQRRILTVLAQHGPRTKIQVAILAGYAHGGGGFNNALGALRSAGGIEGRELLSATDAGLDALGDVDPLPVGEALIDHWKSRLGRAERLILDTLRHAWPQPASKEDLAASTGYAAGGGGFNNALGKLRSLELIEGRTDIVLSPSIGDGL